METGVRATVRFPDPGDCPVARFAADAIVENVSTSVVPPDDGGSVSEFLVDSDTIPMDAEDTRVFSYGDREVHRVAHGECDCCPCMLLGAHGCPIHRFSAADGELTLVFHVEEFDRLQPLMADLRERCPPVDVRRLLQPPFKTSPEWDRFVSLGRLTDRQREVLRVAYERGYFKRPKGANATELAADLNISQSTFTEHLNAAQRKLLGDIFDAAE